MLRPSRAPLRPLVLLLLAAFGVAQDPSPSQGPEPPRRTLLTFGAAWCPHCQWFQAEVADALFAHEALRGVDVVRHDIDREPRLARQWGVEASPTLILLGPGGEELGRRVGAPSLEEALAFLADPRGEGDTGRAVDLVAAGGVYRGKSICFSHVGYGPIPVQSMSPGHSLRLGLAPRAPSTLLEGQREVRVGVTYANIWAQRDGDFRLDHGLLQSRLSLAYGLTNTLLLDVALTNLSRTPSFLDGVTNTFHELFGFGEAGRGQFPDHDNAIEFEPGYLDEEVRDTQSGTFADDLTVTLQHNVTCGTEHLPAIAVAATVRQHLGGSVSREGSDTSWGLSASLSRRVAQRHYLYLGLAYNRHGADRILGIDLRDETAEAQLAWEWRRGAFSSWTLQYLVTSGFAEDADPFDRPAHEILLGYQREFSKGRVLELGLIENAVVADNSPDFGLHVGFRQRF